MDGSIRQGERSPRGVVSVFTWREACVLCGRAPAVHDKEV